jgi:hypothetical protein
MGSIYKRGRIWWIAYCIRGAQRYESARTEERNEAETLLKQRESEAGVRRLVRSTDAVALGAGVYFLRSRATGLVKVGCSSDLDQRVKETTFSPEHLQIVARIPVTRGWWLAEKILHDFLAEHRVKGEWFQITAEQIEAAIKHWARTCDEKGGGDVV